jgi:uncharacterized protein DUF4234
MGELVTIDGQTFKKREPLGVLGLTLITFGIYGLYWYYQVNDELRRFERDDSISPTRSLMAILFGWIIIVPPFIAVYNTAQHIQAIERREGIQPIIEPVLAVIFLLLLSIIVGFYLQAHLNPIWVQSSGPPPRSALPPAPAGG